MANRPGAVPRPLIAGIVLAAGLLNAWLIRGALRDGREAESSRQGKAGAPPSASAAASD